MTRSGGFLFPSACLFVVKSTLTGSEQLQSKLGELRAQEQSAKVQANEGDSSRRATSLLFGTTITFEVGALWSDRLQLAPDQPS